MIGTFPSGKLDLEAFVKQVYDIYQRDEVAVKKERLVHKKLNDLISQTYTMKITCSDSIAYDRKEDRTTIKSKEVYYHDQKTGYFGVFVIAEKKGDDLLMTSSPEKEMTITGRIDDVIVIHYKKGENFVRCYTPLKEFDDSGTVIQQIILKVTM